MIDREEAIDWALGKHERMVMVIPTANKNPWPLHGPETLCIGCLPVFVGDYLADIPDVFARVDEEENEVGGI